MNIMCCRRIKLLRNIEGASVDEIVEFVKRMLKWFYLFTLISFGDIFLLYFFGADISAWTYSSIALALYIINSFVIYRLVKYSPSSLSCLAALVSLTAQGLLNIAITIHEIILDKEYWSAINFLGVLLQASTLYIIYNLKLKLDRIDHGDSNFNTVAAINSPLSAPLNV